MHALLFIWSCVENVESSVTFHICQFRRNIISVLRSESNYLFNNTNFLEEYSDISTLKRNFDLGGHNKVISSEKCWNHCSVILLIWMMHKCRTLRWITFSRPFEAVCSSSASDTCNGFRLIPIYLREQQNTDRLVQWKFFLWSFREFYFKEGDQQYSVIKTFSS